MTAFRYRRISDSNVAEHLIKNNHNIDNLKNNLQILEICNDDKKLVHLEKFYIYKYLKEGKLLMNTQSDFKNNLLYNLTFTH